MIQRAVAVAGLLLLAAVLESALFPAVTLLGFRPDLTAVLVLGIALRDGPLAGARVGAVGGALSDLLVSQSPVGLAVLVYAGIGYGAGVVRPYLAPDSVTAPVLLAFASAGLATLAIGVGTSLLGEVRIAAAALVEGAFVVALYSTLVAPAAVWGVDRLVERFPLRGHAATE